jgi:hypothetical protein
MQRNQPRLLPVLGLRDPRSIAQGRNTLYAMLGGKVQLRPAQRHQRRRPDCSLVHGTSVVQEAAGVTTVFRVRSRRNASSVAEQKTN